jgi:hypothetical protein
MNEQAQQQRSVQQKQGESGMATSSISSNQHLVPHNSNDPAT